MFNKKMVYSDSTTNSESCCKEVTSTYSMPQCPYLLPCGTCRLMFMICPKHNESKWEITYTNNIENK